MHAATLLLLLAASSGDGHDLTARFEVPEGTAVTLWAESPLLFNPTCLDVDAKGRVWVAEAVNYRTWGGRNPGRRHPEGDRIVILEDTDRDGVADSSKVFVQDADLVAPVGLAVIDGSVYVSSAPNLFRYVDEDGDDVSDRREVLLTGFGGFDHDHGLHSVVAGPNGRLWFNAGNAGPHLVTDASGWSLRSGSIYNGGGPSYTDNKPGLISDDGMAWTGGLVLSVLPDGTDLRVHAHNFRNNYEVALDSLGNFYQSDNDDDGNRSCRTLWCLEFGDHGYFSADGTRSWRADKRPGQDTQTAHWHQDDPGVVPAGAINGAGGPTGGAVYEGELLAGSIGGAFLNADAGASVVYAHQPQAVGAGVEMKPGALIRPAGGLEDEGARWFRPSDVTVGTGGEVYVADWYDPGVGGHAAGDREAYGRILKIAPSNALFAPPALGTETPESALAVLANPAVNVREAGRRAIEAHLAELGPAASGAWLDGVWSDASEAMRGRLLGLADETLARRVVEGVTDASPGLRAAAARTLRRAGGLTLELCRNRELARDPSAAMRREVALASRGVPLDAKLDLLLDLAERYDGEDRTYLEAFGLAVKGQEEEFYAELVAELGDSPLRWDARFSGLAWRLHPEAAVPAHFARAMSESLPTAERRRTIDALAFTGARAAAEAVMTIALSGPADLRSYARWWVDFRSDNDWRAYGLGEQLGSADLEGATLAFESGVLSAGSVPFEVDVTGAETVWLVVTDGGNGNSCDWATWVEPRFRSGEGETLLTQLTWLSAEAQWGSVGVDKNPVGGPLKLADESVVRGLGTHAASTIAYAVPEGTEHLVGSAGPDFGGTSQGGATTVAFQVWVKRPDQPAPVAAWVASMLDGDLDLAERRSAAEALARHPSGALLLLRHAEQGTLPAGVRSQVAESIHQNPDIGVRALASAHFPLPGADADYPSIAELIAMDGDPRRGREVFLDRERAQCVTCHAFELGDTLLGGDIGPDLTGIREKYGTEALLDSILNPNAGIAFGYDTWLIETTDGLLKSGFLLADGANVVLKDTQGFRHVIPVDEIAHRTKQTVSTMPEGVAFGLQPQELVDLVAFLEADQSEAPRLGEEVVLFDGSSLNAWTYHLNDPAMGFDDVWGVEDGVLKCGGKPAGYLRTKASFESYLLTLEWRFDPDRGAGNSGVLLRMIGADKVWPRSIEAQLQSGNAGDFWNIDKFEMQAEPSRTNGRHTSRQAPSSEKPLGEWNRYEILVNGPRVELRVNGVLQNTADWCAEIPGKICLQSEGAYIEFRDIRLRELVR